MECWSDGSVCKQLNPHSIERTCVALLRTSGSIPWLQALRLAEIMNLTLARRLSCEVEVSTSPAGAQAAQVLSQRAGAGC
jgi:hypothetical protein